MFASLYIFFWFYVKFLTDESFWKKIPVNPIINFY